MSGHDMTPKLVPEAQRAFEVEPGTLSPMVACGLGNGFTRNVHRKPILALVHDGQADAGAGDRSPEVDRFEVVGRCDNQPQVAALLGAADGADVCDDPGEHGPALSPRAHARKLRA